MESFREIFARRLRAHTGAPPPLAPGECHTSAGRTCTLCHASAVDYTTESDARNEALQDFWRNLPTKSTLSNLVRSPLGRHYRTTSKRKAFEGKNEMRLALIDPSENSRSHTMDVGGCAIEPPGHAAIYSYVQQSLLKSYARPIVRVLRYVVIKGSYTDFIVIFTVAQIEGPLVKAVNTLSKSLTRALPDVKGIMLFEDKSDGRYYLGTRNPSSRGDVRKIFGKEEVHANYGGKVFRYPVYSFSQINASLVDAMISEAGRLLALTSDISLYDLYCGYGLFTLTLGRPARLVIGVERSPVSTEAAAANSARQHATNVRFVRSDITAETLGPLITAARPGDAMILDPSRGGTAPGVIECIAARQPGRVVHLFCNIDLISMELDQWRKAGFTISEAIPFDMFPGTDDCEVMVLLEPSATPSST